MEAVPVTAGDVPELDPVIHAQARLRVVATLNAMGGGDEIAFPALKDLLGMTAGNLSVHLTKLEEAGYIQSHKEFVRKKPHTTYTPTDAGRDAFPDAGPVVAHGERIGVAVPAVPIADH